MDERTAARMPRKLAHDCSEEGRLAANAADMISTTSANRMQIPVTTRAVRYVGVFLDSDSEVTGDVGEVARGK